MENTVHALPQPGIVIAEEDLEALSDVAESLLDVLPDVGRFLDDELARARVMPLRAMPPDVVTMNATVEFTLEKNARVERLKLVYPADYVADGSCVSIASPVGVALLGLKEKQSISWTSRHGDQLSLRVLKLISRVAG
jgi:regulator of nucleoside diphosphate kinase